jgi:hypothetical protein|tara:strand:+ start:477 stop:797 length:321 start_codon:yes stop_codon:yes gene_type:complete
VNEKPKTARSYRGNVIDDNLVLSFNFKFLVNILLVGGSILYGWFSLQERITSLEKEVLEANDEIRNLMAKHQLEESAQLEELESKLKFYEKELNINPLSWRKRKKK